MTGIFVGNGYLAAVPAGSTHKFLDIVGIAREIGNIRAASHMSVSSQLPLE